MAIWVGFGVFIFGTIVGSFLNVVIYRYQTGRGVVRGRSGCMTCGRTLEWYELVPVVSWLIQLGRCRGCGSKISAQYPIVELAAGLLFLGVFGRFGLDWLSLLIYWAILGFLLIITAYDLKHKIIPDPWAYSFAALSALQLFLLQPKADWPWTIITALGLFAFFALLWLFSGGRWMGFGDAKLALGIGLLLSPRLAISAIIFGFWLGAAVGLGLILFSRLLGRGQSFTIKNEIPFAPFLVAGVVASFFFNFNVIFF